MRYVNSPAIILLLILIGPAIYGILDIVYHCISLTPHLFIAMKPSAFYTTLYATLTVFLLVIACHRAVDHPMTDYTLIIDETDSTFAVPETEALAADLGIDTNIWGGVTFNFTRIIDVSYVPHTTIALSKGPSRLAGNKYTRQKEVDAFREKFSGLLESAQHDATGKPRSSIYLPLVDELTKLSNSFAYHRILTIYSDMRENTKVVSFYDPQTARELVTDPDKIKAKLLEEAPLPDLRGIEIQIIHAPQNEKDDTAFRASSGFFKALFEEHGATVTVSANLSVTK